jgi:hypothetical protein
MNTRIDIRVEVVVGGKDGENGIDGKVVSLRDSTARSQAASESTRCSKLTDAFITMTTGEYVSPRQVYSSQSGFYKLKVSTTKS